MPLFSSKLKYFSLIVTLIGAPDQQCNTAAENQQQHQSPAGDLTLTEGFFEVINRSLGFFQFGFETSSFGADFLDIDTMEQTPKIIPGREQLILQAFGIKTNAIKGSD